MQAKSLIELLLYCILVICSLLCGLNHYFNKPQEYNDFLKLQKLGDALNLARSEAISKNIKVSVCPSYDLLICSSRWSNDLIIFNDLTILHHIQLNFSDKTVQFRGNQQTQKITFFSNGLTSNNGNFCVNKGQHCLYINKAGKVYIISK